MDQSRWGVDPLDEGDAAARAAGDAALVVSAASAKRWKDALDAKGWLDRARRTTSFAANETEGTPAAVAFPVTVDALDALRVAASDDPDALALCRARLAPLAALPDQRAMARAAASANASATTDGAPLPPSLDPQPDAPPLWPPPVPRARPVRRVPCPNTRDEFAAEVSSLGEPVVLTGVPMGDAPRLWTPEYLARCAEADALVDVHVCPPRGRHGGAGTGTGTRDRDGDGDGDGGPTVVDLAGHRAPGTPRNFEFRKMPFGELVRRVSGTGTDLSPVVARGERYYLRSVAKRAPAHLPSSFPSLGADLTPGAVVPGDGNRDGDGTLYPEGAYHSSVLRIASPGTALWTHYDTHNNLLAQVVGRKTITLWPPDAEPFLYVEGSSSRVDDIDPDGDAPARFPTFAAVSRERRVVELGPGEALYIPALWFHHVLSHPPGTDGAASVAVNVFWRSLPEGEHDPGDLYGNKDPPAARRAAELAARAGAAVANLPEPQQRFYARRAIRRLAAQLGMELGGV